MRKTIIIISFIIFILCLLPVLYYVFMVHPTGSGSLGAGVLEMFFGILAAVNLLVTIIALVFSKPSDQSVVSPSFGIFIKVILSLIGGCISYFLLIFLIPLITSGKIYDLKKISMIAVPVATLITIVLFIISSKKRNA